jgi:hypothetical protein
MSVKIETSVSNDTLQSLDPLKTTTDAMHLYRVTVELENAVQWYKIIREANALYGLHNWRGQPRVKRKLEKNWSRDKVRVWFDVPDQTFATWISVKHSVIARVQATK